MKHLIKNKLHRSLKTEISENFTNIFSQNLYIF